MPYVLRPNGTLLNASGLPFSASEVSASDVEVPHLPDHVVPFVMPRGDIIGLRIRYTSHCWTERYDPVAHDPTPIIFRDHRRKPRVFDKTRFDDSKGLVGMISNLAEMRVYWTPADRNFGVYNATAIVSGVAYTAYFTLHKSKGTISGQRYILTLDVESAYRDQQPSPGSTVKAAAAIDATLKNKKLVYRG